MAPEAVCKVRFWKKHCHLGVAQRSQTGFSLLWTSEQVSSRSFVRQSRFRTLVHSLRSSSYTTVRSSAELPCCRRCAGFVLRALDRIVHDLSIGRFATCSHELV